MKKKKILIVSNSLYGGGAEKILQTILCNLNYDKYDITLCTFHKDIIDYRYYPRQVKYKFLFNEKKIKLLDKLNGKIFEKLPIRLFYFLNIHSIYDIEIAFIEGESTKLISGSYNKHSKKIAWVHVDLINTPWTDVVFHSNEEEVSSYNSFDKILCVSESVKKAFLKKYTLNDPKKVSVQYNPINEVLIKKQSLENNRNYYLADNESLKLIAVGRLVEQKGFDRLLRVVKRLKNDGFKFHLLILGDGEKKNELEKYITSNKLVDFVSLLGFKENPYFYMKQSNLLICSSISEGFSTVIAEGLILGLPIVSTRCAGINELFGNRKCGIITENNEDSLYEGLKKIMLNKDCISEYAKEAYLRGLDFSLSNKIREIEELFDNL